MENKMFTIVVPMYNSQRFLKECLDSLVNQTLTNFKVILIDDGSIDQTKEIASKYVKRFPDLFKYVYQENKGLGGARNTGISMLDTEYAIFLDSDDFIASKMIENITNYLATLSFKPDIILSAPKVYNYINKSYFDFYDNQDIEYLFKDETFLNVKKCPNLLSMEASFWRCIWRTEFLLNSGVAFVEHIAWEDVHPHFSLFYKANYIVKYSDSPTFFYRINTGNQITSGSGKTRLDIPTVFNMVIDQMRLENWTPEERAQVIKTMHKFVIWSYKCIDDEYRVEYVERVHQLYKKIRAWEFRAYKKYVVTSFKIRAMIIAFRSRLFSNIIKSRVRFKIISSYYHKAKRKIKKLLRRA